MSISKQIPDAIKRTAKAIGYAAWLDHTDGWQGLSKVLRARLSDRQRAALAFAALTSLDHATACRVADAALGDPIEHKEAA